MCKYAMMVIILATCAESVMRASAERTNDGGVGGNGDDLRITAVSTKVTDKVLEIRYQIKNESPHDAWICEDISVLLNDYDFEAYMAEDRETLLIRRRLDVDPCKPVAAPPHGRYLRLPEGQSRSESLFLRLPVEARFFWRSPASERSACAKRLVLEIGYYSGDLPGMIRRIIEEPGSPQTIYGTDGIPQGVTPPLKDWFKSILYFNWYNWPNQNVWHRDEEIQIPWTGSTRIGERVLRIALDGLEIPYEEKYDRPKTHPPDLSRCTRLEILYQPSLLDCFFPYPNERTLLSPEELTYLQSLRTVIVDDQEQIKAFSRELSKQKIIGGIISERSSAHVVCYDDSDHLTSFTIYDGRAIVTEDGQCIRCIEVMPSLKRLTATIQPFALRLECANNLMNLSSLLQFLYGDDKSYPVSQWCDALVNDRRLDDLPDDYEMKYLMCPAADQAKCHYAMNSKCRPGSATDTVLLFETKAGWNQHGGPELFRFGNHDPKGGCVLLNDGTVKFIRTEEELKQLRWK
ncbi:MAG: hypothetical protein ABFE13_16960 [Phycisphaerales bacterium]